MAHAKDKRSEGDPMTIAPDLDTITLEIGDHATRADGVCIVELAAWLKGIEHTDRIECCSQVVQSFVRRWNDDLDDEGRQLLKPYAARLLDTTPDPATEEARAWLLTDWLVRVCAPAWLELAGVEESPAALRALPEITAATVRVAQPTLDTAREQGAAAWAAARDAAWAAAGAAARDAARDAAWDAARDAAWEKLEPTKTALQHTAFDLLDRMIALEPQQVAA